MDEGSDTGEKLALKFICENFAAKFIYPFSRKRENVDYFYVTNRPYDRLSILVSNTMKLFSAQPYSAFVLLFFLRKPDKYTANKSSWES